ncbi:4-hydroxy-tetrahydrodipicolinate reductase [Sphingomonas sp. HT-1]|uniref:4-hydroxy-tetrahydrodipicolinate reductase n=1 Tax=unclassified Sphingomonas TaxID=196159 RepID=UPI0002DCD4E6|nr:MULTISPECIES: 4-hydroxy-tetrahydrodipicolinate reductase [unclassified Sphingomonas]KTF70345.1 4-hydroxy-tetrahydrodipicolinate reductase [Sphingomonas sp. WG]
MTSIGIFGSMGRMGQAISAALPEFGAQAAGGVDVGDDPAALARKADVIVDFSAPAALEANLAAARAARTPIVIGTTGLAERHHRMIDAAAAEIAVLQTGNTSLGIGLLSRLVQEAARRLGQDWDIEIVEMHHRNKADAPSGTALMLGAAAAEAMGTTLAEAGVSDRAGLTGPRAAGTIGMASLRGGSVIGDHSVVFASDGERIELIHRADDRAIFAKGAIRAALWLAGREPGRYTMDQVLGV